MSEGHGAIEMMVCQKCGDPHGTEFDPCMCVFIEGAELAPATYLPTTSVEAVRDWARAQADKVEADYEQGHGRAPGWERATGFVVGYRAVADKLDSLLPESEGTDG